MSAFPISGAVNESDGSGGITPRMINSMKRRAQAGAGVDRVAQYRWNPFIQSTNLDIPTQWAQRNQFKRYFFRTNPIVGAALELHSEFPLSNFHLVHEDPAIEEFLNNMFEDCGFFEILLQVALEYWLIGEASTFGFLDDYENPSHYTGFVILDPDKTSVVSSNFVQGPNSELVHLQMDPIFQTIANQGPNHPVTGELYKRLPSDMIQAAQRNVPLKLSPLQVSRIKRGNYFSTRGESILERIFPLCMYKDKLRSAQYVIADRHITPTEMFKIGETGDPADSRELEDFREAIAATYLDVNKLIVCHHAVNYEAVGTSGKILPLWTEFDSIDNEICAGLLINKGLIMGDSSTFASDVIRYDILINRYLIFRTKIERWILRHILTPILRIHEMYVPEYKVKSMSYRLASGMGRPLHFPSIRWDKQSLRDENAKLELLTKLVEKGLVPESMLIQLLNIDPMVAREKVEQEQEQKVERKAAMIKRIKAKGIQMTPEFAQMLGFQGATQDPSGPDAGFGGSLPSSIDSGAGDSGGAPSGMPEADLPEVVPGAGGPGASGGEGASGGIPKSDGIQGAPPGNNAAAASLPSVGK